MKKFRSIIQLVFISVSVLFISCVYEPLDGAIDLDNNTNIPVSSGFFKADFKGTTWTANQVQAMVSDGIIEIAGVKSSGEGFVFLIEAPGVGTYPANVNLLSFTPAGTDNGYWSINDSDPDENTGSITISSINTAKKTISGTFSFKGYWAGDVDASKLPIQFTNGVFKDIPYTTVHPDTNTDSFYAKSDGIEFIEDDIDVVEVTSTGVSDYYSIVASKSNGDSMGLSIAQSLGVGTYQFAGLSGQQVNANCNFNNLIYIGNTGSVTITSKTATRIAGTFNVIVENFTTGGTKSISGGTFDVEY